MQCCKNNRKLQIEVYQKSIDSMDFDILNPDLQYNLIATIFGEIKSYKPYQYFNGVNYIEKNYTHKITIKYRDFMAQEKLYLKIKNDWYQVISYVIDDEKNQTMQLYVNKEGIHA
jgi:hypothetical protein